MTSYSSRYWAPGLLMLCLSGPACAAEAEAPPATLTLDEIYRGADAVRKRIKSIRVEYAREIRQVLVVPSQKSSLGGESLFGKGNTTFVMSGDRRYLNVTWENQPKFMDQPIVVFDGNYSYLYQIGQLDVREDKDKRCEEMETYCREILEIPVTDREKAEYDNSWRYPHCLRPGWFQRHRVLPKQEMIDGAWCHVVTQPQRQTLWVDHKLGFAVRRKELFQPAVQGSTIIEGKVLRLVDYSYSKFVEVEPGIWLPTFCKKDLYARTLDPAEYWNKKDKEEIIQVSSLSVNKVTDDDFQIQLPPGTWVMSPSGAFQLSGNRAVLLREIATGLPTPTNKFSAMRMALLISAVVLSLLVAGVFLWRFSVLRRARTPAGDSPASPQTDQAPSV